MEGEEKKEISHATRYGKKSKAKPPKGADDLDVAQWEKEKEKRSP